VPRRPAALAADSVGPSDMRGRGGLSRSAADALLGGTTARRVSEDLRDVLAVRPTAAETFGDITAAPAQLALFEGQQVMLTVLPVPRRRFTRPGRLGGRARRADREFACRAATCRAQKGVR
jgi:hypothetical protein